jgi:chromatin segregation and condensation protein Rec8/ScpA/Scc1 (kleisin family)
MARKKKDDQELPPDAPGEPVKAKRRAEKKSKTDETGPSADANDVQSAETVEDRPVQTTLDGLREALRKDTAAEEITAETSQLGPANDEASSPVDSDEDVLDASEDENIYKATMENKDLIDSKFWQKNDYFRSLLDPEIIKKLDLTTYDLAKLLNEFFNEMFKGDYIDFKVSGIAVHSAAKIYRWKILEVLEQQEKEEEERKKEMLRRNIPNTISQPLRPGRQIATQEDFMASMRSAIIDVMRRREKQARRATKDQANQPSADEDAKKARLKKRLPEEIMKAIFGKERVEDTFQKWLEIMHIKYKQNKEVSYFNDLKPLLKDKYSTDLARVIDPESPTALGIKTQYKFDLARLFMSMMFLRNRDKIDLAQADELQDILVTKA